MLELCYGQRKLPFTYDPERFTLLDPPEADTCSLTDTELITALENPIDSPSLAGLVNPGESVVIVVPDATRAAEVARITNLLVQHLNPAQISILIGGGTH